MRVIGIVVALVGLVTAAAVLLAGDGVADPQDLDDAALAAAAYLCAGGRDTADGDGWWDGVLAYNRSLDYARRVWTAADHYATGAS